MARSLPTARAPCVQTNLREHEDRRNARVSRDVELKQQAAAVHIPRGKARSETGVVCAWGHPTAGRILPARTCATRLVQPPVLALRVRVHCGQRRGIIARMPVERSEVWPRHRSPRVARQHRAALTGDVVPCNHVRTVCRKHVGPIRILSLAVAILSPNELVDGQQQWHEDVATATEDAAAQRRLTFWLLQECAEFAGERLVEARRVRALQEPVGAEDVDPSHEDEWQRSARWRV
eukprot:4367250-Prymnesium_polylepis.2